MPIHILEIKFTFNQQEDVLYPVLLQDANELILVDCGYAGFMSLIEEATRQHGLSLQNLTGIIITHHDNDHMGGLFEIKARYPEVKIYSSLIEEKYISGKEKSLRLAQAEALLHMLPEDQKPWALDFQQQLRAVLPVKVDYTFSEEEFFMKSIRVVATPGHMPGHISLYLPESKTLIAADALVYQDGELDIANPMFTLDLPEALKSIKKLLTLDIHTLVCYHGGITQGDISNKLSTLLTKYAAS